MKVGIIRCMQTEDYCPGITDFKIIREHGADTIAFASCIRKGTPIGYPCPFAKKMKEIRGYERKIWYEKVHILRYPINIAR